MAWNGSASSAQAPKPVKKGGGASPALKGILAGVIVVIGAVAAFFLLTDKDAKPVEKPLAKKAELIKEVASAPAPKAPPKAEEPKVEKPAPKPAAPAKFVPPTFPDDMDPEERDVKLRRAKWEWKLTHDMRLRNFLEKHKPAESAFKSKEEQVIDWIFTCKVGDDVPPPLPQMQEFEKNHLLEILETGCEIKETDDEKTIERKKVVDDVKKELAEYVKQGGKVQDFLEYYRNELAKAREIKNVVTREVAEAINSGDPDQGVETLDKGNEILRKKGITEVELNADQIQALQDGLNKQKGNNK